MSGKFESLIRILEKELKLTGTEIAEILWLTLQSSPHSSTSGSTSGTSSSTTSGSTSSSGSGTTSGSTSGTGSSTTSGSTSSTGSGTTNFVPVSPINGGNSSRKKKSGSSLPIKVPDVASLRHPLQIAKALRPLIQYIASGKAVFLDEEATINRIAELEGICIPVLKSPLELRFDLALVVDKSDSMIFWQRATQELQQLLKHYGIFRNMQTWEMVTAKKEQDNLQAPENIYLRRWTRKKRANHEQKSSSFNLYSPKKLVDPSGRRLILVVSDCVNPIWHNGKAFSVLKTWGKHNIVAILQMLPERMWLRTALNLGAMVQLDSRIPAVANRNLYIKEMLIWDDVTENDLKVPVFCLQPESAETWCEMVAGKSPIGAGGFVFPLDFIKEQVEGEENKSETFQLSSKERVDNFNMSSSPLARNLARLLAAAPVINLPIVRLIQRTLLTQSDQVHVAEVFLGGILKPQELITPETEADQVLYRFIDDDSDGKDEKKIRGLLLSESPKTDSRYIIEVISRYFAKQMGKNLKDFYALLTKPDELEKLKQEKNINEFDVKHFAEISTQVLKHLGGAYARFAESIEAAQKVENGSKFPPSPPISLPSRTEDIEIVTVKVLRGGEEELFKQLRSKVDQSVISNSQLYQRMLEQIKLLPEEYRIPLELKYLEGVSDREIVLKMKIYQEELDRRIDSAINLLFSQLFVKQDLLLLQSETVFVHRTGTISERKPVRAYYYSANIYDSTASQEDNEYLENKLNLDMVYLPGGTFMMGTEDEEIERLVKKFNWEGYRREKPQHQVTVPSFYMSKYPITQGQWKAIALRIDLKVKEDLDLEPSYFKGNPQSFAFTSTRSKLDLPSYGDHPTRWDRPVERVNWYQAKEFCDRLSQLTGQEYRLPTEAEWEYACRAVTSEQLSVTSEQLSVSSEQLSVSSDESEINQIIYSPFHFGETITSDLANYNGTEIYADEPKGVSRGETTPVGMFPPNGFGLYDLHGNVWEWCEDSWHKNYENAPRDGSAWITENKNTNVMRGGSWLNIPDYCRCAYRFGLNTRALYDDAVGFRVVCVFGRTS